MTDALPVRGTSVVVGDGKAVGAASGRRYAGQVSITASHSGQTTDSYSAGYQDAPGCSEGFQRAVSMAKVSLPQRVLGPVELGAPGAAGAACTLRTGRSSPLGVPGDELVATALSSSYTTTISLMSLV